MRAWNCKKCGRQVTTTMRPHGGLCEQCYQHSRIKPGTEIADSNRYLAQELKRKGLTYREIGEQLNISRQRAQQLTSPPIGIRQLVYQKAGGKCEICGLKLQKTGHIHHKGGELEDYNDIENLQLLCSRCHSLSHPEYIRGAIEASLDSRSQKFIKEYFADNPEGLKAFEAKIAELKAQV